MNKPEIWLSEKDNVKRNYKLVERLKCDGITERQSRTVKVKDGYCWQETFVQLHSVSDRGEFWYVGYVPVGKDAGACGFGYTRIYKSGDGGYYDEFQDVTDKIDINTGERIGK